MSNFGSRFRASYIRAGITKAEIARRLGITPQSVQKYESGGRPDTENLQRLADLLGVSADWLLTGRQNLNENPDMTGRVGRRGGRVVPKVDVQDAAQGLFSRVIGEYHTYFPCGPRSFLVDVSDDSNSPRYEVGDVVVVDPDRPPVPGRMVFASVGDQKKPVIGRYVRRSVNAHTVEVVEHINSVWGEHVIDGQTSIILGTITEHASAQG